MNIKDIELDWDELKTKYGVTDWLAMIFYRQKELMDRYQEIERINGAITIPAAAHGELDSRTVQMRLKDLAYRTVEELSEATNCLKNKPWKQDQVLTDRDHFYEELADAFHFFVELCITSGLEAEDLFQLYFLKSEVNKFRQRSNY